MVQIGQNKNLFQLPKMGGSQESGAGASAAQGALKFAQQGAAKLDPNKAIQGVSQAAGKGVQKAGQIPQAAMQKFQAGGVNDPSFQQVKANHKMDQPGLPYTASWGINA